MAALTWCFADAKLHRLASAVTELYGQIFSGRAWQSLRVSFLKNALQELNCGRSASPDFCMESHSGPHHLLSVDAFPVGHCNGLCRDLTSLHRSACPAHALTALSVGDGTVHHDGGFAHEDHIPLFLHDEMAGSNPGVDASQTAPGTLWHSGVS